MKLQPKSVFSCGPGDGRNFFYPRACGRKGEECPREIWTEKSMFTIRAEIVPNEFLPGTYSVPDFEFLMRI